MIAFSSRPGQIRFDLASNSFDLARPTAANTASLVMPSDPATESTERGTLRMFGAFEVAAVRHGPERPRNRPVFQSDYFVDLGRGPDVKRAFFVLAVGVLRREKTALLASHFAQQVVERLFNDLLQP